MEAVKFAVVGLGNIGPRHLAVLDYQPQAEIVAICDIDPEKCKKYSAMYDNVPSFLSYEEMLRRTNPDVVSICTPHGLHAPMSIASAEAGKHILVEKPMALTVADAKRMIASANSHGVRAYGG